MCERASRDRRGMALRRIALHDGDVMKGMDYARWNAGGPRGWRGGTISD